MNPLELICINLTTRYYCFTSHMLAEHMFMDGGWTSISQFSGCGWIWKDITKKNPTNEYKRSNKKRVIFVL